MSQASTPSTKRRYERLLRPLSGTFSIVIAPNFEYPVLMYLKKIGQRVMIGVESSDEQRGERRYKAYLILTSSSSTCL